MKMTKIQMRNILSSEKLYNEWRQKQLGTKFHNELLRAEKENQKQIFDEYIEELDPDYINLEGSYAEDKFTEQTESYYQKKY